MDLKLGAGGGAEVDMQVISDCIFRGVFPRKILKSGTSETQFAAI